MFAIEISIGLELCVYGKATAEWKTHHPLPNRVNEFELHQAVK